MLRSKLILFLKALLIGISNSIPGLSGGTIAFITGIYDKLIKSISNINRESIQLLLKGKLRKFFSKFDVPFISIVFAGVLIGFFISASILDYFFKTYQIYVWSLFLGLVVGSLIVIMYKIKAHNVSIIIAFLFGFCISFLISLLSPGVENSNFLYLFICGILAVASTIIPGLSGAYVLILLGNYNLIITKSSSDLLKGEMSSLKILIPVAIGAFFAILTLSKILDWIFTKFYNLAISLISGFIGGSIFILWPWKVNVEDDVNTISEKLIIFKNFEYQWYMPNFSTQTLIAVFFIILGIFSIVKLEKISSKNT